MKKRLLCLAFISIALSSFSQKVYFVYLQSETAQPFYVRMNEKLYSSSAAGYLILSKLRDSSYSFDLGFPGNKWPEQHFSVLISKKDHGYLLKNFGDKGWGLFDLQTLSVQMSAPVSTKTEGTAVREEKEVPVFTDMLSKASDDPSLRDKPVQPKAEEKKPDPVTPVIVKKEEPKEEQKESLPAKPAESKEPEVVKKEESKEPVKVTPDPKIATVAEQPPVKKEDVQSKEPLTAKKEEPKEEKKEPEISRKEESKGPVKNIPDTLLTVVTEPPAGKKNDPPQKEPEKTILEAKPVTVAEQPAITKEEPKREIKEQPPPSVEEKKEVVTDEYKPSVVTRRSESSTTEGFGLVFTDDSGEGGMDTIRILIPNPKPVVAPVKEEPKEEKKFLDLPPVDTTTVIPAKKTVEEEKLPLKNGVKNNCPGAADESDFFKLRKKMASVSGDDGMVIEAKKYFKTKCFTTLQLKNLALLFLNDEGKYKFFDAAYASVSDIENFPSLQSELKEEYYINRFRAMIR